jgi:translation initiation factor IF-3
MFRGREVQHPELGERLLRRLAGDLEDLGRVESQPNLDGRNMVMVMAPKKDSRETQPSQSNGRTEQAARS